MPAAQTLATKRSELPRFAASLSSQPLLLGLVLTALLSALRSAGSVDSDVAWQLWIAGRLHHGANLYSDIIETNPPLWFWMGVPADRLAALLNVRVEPVLVVLIGCLVALALVATDRLMRHVPQRRRSLFLGYAALALVAMPWMHAGQREQLVLIATLPYSALVAARRERRRVDPLLALLVGAGAASGFALKHYFLLVPALLELWLAAGMRREWRPLRPETLALAGLGSAYGAAILLFEPDFLVRVLPLIRLAYADFGAHRALELFGPYALVTLAILAVLIANLRTLKGRSDPTASALALAAAGYTAVYFIQFKGWPYQAIPMVGCGSLAIAALLAEADTPSATLRIFGPALLLLPLLLGEEEARFRPPQNVDLAEAISGLEPGDAVGFLTTENAVPWSVTLQHHFRYTSRYDGFWMMRAVVLNEREGGPDQRLTNLGKQVVSETVDDFRCVPPKRIIVSRPRPNAHEFDILPFFERDPRFAELMSHYRLRSRTSFEAYDLVSRLPAPAVPCRKGI